LQKTVRAIAKINLMIPCMVGKEDSKDEEMVDNIITIYENVVNALPNGNQNIKNVYLKLTMGKPVKVG
jgi:ribosomal protein L1